MILVRRLRFLLFVGSFLVASPFTYADGNPMPLAVSKQFKPVTSSTLKDADWVRLCIDQYPEILFLADKNVRNTEEGWANELDAYSEQLFNEKFIEFDRTIMTLHCLRLILKGNEDTYREFTKDQPQNTRLSRQSFNNLHTQGIALLKSNYRGMSELEMAQDLEAALILGDLGKSQKARDLFKPYGANTPDHDVFYKEVIQILQEHPGLCPTFDRCTPEAKRLICQTAHLAHYGHITHLEGGPRMFSKLKQSNLATISPIALLFDFFVHTCDVAGALGHVNNQSSLVYTEQTHFALQGVLSACKVLQDPNKTEIDAYNAYLTIRAKALGLNIQNRLDRTLVRVGAMLRLFTPEDGIILKQAILKLPPRIQTQIIDQFDSKEELEHTPTYMPAVLVNLASNPQLGSSKEERISQAVILGLPFLARVLETHKQHLDARAADPAICLNFNKAAGIAKLDPKALAGKYYIDREGNICIKGTSDV